jgi:hypothetical protein
MKTQETKKEQQNWYHIIDSCGRVVTNADGTIAYIIASNILEATKLMKQLKRNGFNWEYSFWKVERCYNGGARG